jgi:hypothetical protein
MTLKEDEKVIAAFPGVTDHKIVERLPVIGFAVTSRGGVRPLIIGGWFVSYGLYEEDGTFYALLHPTGEVETEMATPWHLPVTG